MIWKIVLVLGVAVSVRGDEEAVSEQRVSLHHPKHVAVVSQADDKQENHKDYDWSYPSYEFSYKVKDPHTHDIKGQKEERDGDKVKGDYWLIEPTGRKRTVQYHADDKKGFNAHVDYTKSEYSLKQNDQNKQDEDRSLNVQDGKQIQTKGNKYEVTEGYNNEDRTNIEINNRDYGNNNEKGELENINDQRSNIQEVGILNNEEENGDGKNNENQEPMSGAIVTLETLNENIDTQDRCQCNERGQNNYRSNINEINNNNGGQDNTSRRKRKNNNRSINSKSGDNNETNKQTEMSEKNNKRKSSHTDRKKNNQNDNLNDRKKKNESVDFGSRNGKQKQNPSRGQYKVEDKPQNNTLKVEKKKEEKEEENFDQNDKELEYQHRILIHHPKAIVPKSKRKS